MEKRNKSISNLYEQSERDKKQPIITNQKDNNKKFQIKKKRNSISNIYASIFNRTHNKFIIDEDLQIQQSKYRMKKITNEINAFNTKINQLPHKCVQCNYINDCQNFISNFENLIKCNNKEEEAIIKEHCKKINEYRVKINHLEANNQFHIFWHNKTQKKHEAEIKKLDEEYKIKKETITDSYYMLINDNINDHKVEIYNYKQTITDLKNSMCHKDELFKKYRENHPDSNTVKNRIQKLKNENTQIKQSYESIIKQRDIKHDKEMQALKKDNELLQNNDTNSKMCKQYNEKISELKTTISTQAEKIKHLKQQNKEQTDLKNCTTRLQKGIVDMLNHFQQHGKNANKTNSELRDIFFQKKTIHITKQTTKKIKIQNIKTLIHRIMSRFNKSY